MLSIKQIELNQKLFITHTFIYYELDDNIISDGDYDRRALELEEVRDTQFEWKHTKYRDVFRGWTSATGISLIDKNDKGNYKFFMRQARDMLEAHKDMLDLLL